MEKIMMI